MPRLVTQMGGPLSTDRRFFRPDDDGGFGLSFMDQGDTYTPPVVAGAVNMPKQQVGIAAQILETQSLPSLKCAWPIQSPKETLELMMPGDVKLFDALASGKLPRNMNDDDAQGIKGWATQLLFEQIVLRSEILSRPDLDESVQTFFSRCEGANQIFTGRIFGASVGLACSGICKSLIRTRAIHGFVNAQDKGAFIFPRLSELSDWAQYPMSRRLKDIDIVGSDVNGRASVSDLIQSLEEHGLSREVARKFVAANVDAIQVDASQANEPLGSIDKRSFRKMELGPDGIKVETLLHETEHLRFEGIIVPLLEAGLLSIRATNKVITSDDLTESEVKYLRYLMGNESLFIQRSGGLALSTIEEDSASERFILSELMARLRQAEAMLLSREDWGAGQMRQMMLVGQSILLIKKAVHKLLDLDPLLQRVVDTRTVLSLQQCGIIDPMQGMSIMLGISLKTPASQR